MTSDQQALLRSILLDPEDDAPRLIYADWLDDHDQPERAEFIRLQIEEARLERSGHRLRWPYECAGSTETHWPCRDCERLLDRARRVWESLRKDRRLIGWTQEAIPADYWDHIDGALTTHLGMERARHWDPSQPGSYCGSATWLRGFIAEVELWGARFVERAGRLFAQHPVQTVKLNDKAPLRIPSGQNWPESARWLRGDTNAWAAIQLPASLFDLLPDDVPVRHGSGGNDFKSYSSVPLANAALQSACLTLGRQSAGLPATVPSIL